MVFPWIDSKWDWRPDEKSFWEYFFPGPNSKDVILNGPKPERDYVLNLFFAKKDYEEVHKKVFYAAFFGAKVATFMSICGIASSRTRNPKVALQITGKMFAYWGGGLTTYGALTAAIANARGRVDDGWNHFLAGATLGSLPAFASKSSGYGAVFGVLFGCTGAYIKYVYDSKQTFRMKRTKVSFSDGNRSLVFKTHSPWWQSFPREPRLKP